MENTKRGDEIPWGETIPHVEKYAVEALEKLEAIDYETSKSATDIYVKFRELHNEVELPENTFRKVLSDLTKDKNSRITKQESRNGYFLTTFSVLRSEDISENNSTIKGAEALLTENDIFPEPDSQFSENSNISKREFLLYPLLEQWLSDQNFRVAKNVFNKRSNETWGNPDVAGIKVEEHLNRFEIEIATIEAKPSKDKWGNNWRKDIFEAISHKRYANRVYFCIAVKFGDKLSEMSDIKYYCELYRVGLILIEINPSLFIKYEGKNISVNGFNEDEKELIFITEKLPAPYDYVPLKYQREFCENTLGIKNITELFNFGDTTKI